MYKTINFKNVDEFKQALQQVNDDYEQLGLQVHELERAWNLNKPFFITPKYILSIIIILFSFYKSNYFVAIPQYAFGIRCIFPNNYFIWEATRPIVDCNFCANVTEPIILSNLTKEEFKPFAYSSKPIVIQQAFLHWPALNIFSLKYFKSLYNQTEDGYKSVDEECQFLHFKSDFISIVDVFSMSEERSINPNSDVSWYVGWYVYLCIIL